MQKKFLFVIIFCVSFSLNRVSSQEPLEEERIVPVPPALEGFQAGAIIGGA